MYWLGLKIRTVLPVNIWNRYPQALRPSKFYTSVLHAFTDYSALAGNKPLMDQSLKDLYSVLMVKMAERPKIVEHYPTVDYSRIWSKLFSAPLSLETRETWWKVIHGALPVRERLVKFKIVNSSKCAFCEQGKESLDHLFTECNYIKLLQALFCH